MGFKRYYVILFFLVLSEVKVLALDKIEFRYQNYTFETKIGDDAEWRETGTLTIEKYFDIAPCEIKRKLYPVYAFEAVTEVATYSSSTLLAWNLFKMIENESTVSWTLIMSLFGVAMASDFITSIYFGKAIKSYNEWVDMNTYFSDLSFMLKIEGLSIEYKTFF